MAELSYCRAKLLHGRTVSRFCLLVNNNNKREIFSIKPIIDFIFFGSQMWGGCEKAYTKSLNHSLTVYYVILCVLIDYPSTIIPELLCDEN